MEETLIQLYEHLGYFAGLISILLNIIISLSGVMPTIMITAANLMFFGFYHGIVISIIGEALGAIVSFIVYRKWSGKWRSKLQHPLLNRLKEVQGVKAFWLILGFRLLPAVPSGVITLGSAISKVSLTTFAAASTLGKIPSLILEAGAIYGFMSLDFEWKFAITLAVVVLLIWKIKK
ncbi:DedA family protein [Lysinibacillus yapensis]|uniref:TVP38/TMEM64 family membrane protein n=1 Tax=Ureibacillus yapensis TaxID=2304605 RepID=A0A396S986_9BACL|nr:VTT domain-containing protein [Lysinibacillus yapensis]RHW37513.1 DedA family protein [Lysinibacillus yapensis]